MRYMTSFYRRLKQLRESHHLEIADVARLCGTDESRVRSWEEADPKSRSYPHIDELMDLCFKTETPLGTLVDFEDSPSAGQLDLPGLTCTGDADLSGVLQTLERELEKLELSGEETEMLRRFREASPENRRMIIQLMA